MGISEAKKYIRDLHKRQSNPYLWPDYLTGLPDKSAILDRLEKIFPKLGKHSLAYVRIGNIQPYLIKYGPDRHAEIIQWAAAILKTSAEGCRNGFAGTLRTHDFMVMCESRHMQDLMAEASGMFQKCMRTYYSESDLKNRSTISFKKNDGGNMRIGLMRLIYVIADSKLPVKRSDLILHMERICDNLEHSDEERITMTRALLC